MPRRVGSYTPEEVSRYYPRRVQLLLRDHRLVDANIHVPERQPLSVYLATRHAFTNLTNVRWVGQDSRPAQHVAIRSDHILWIACLDPDVALSRQTGRTERLPVDVLLEDGSIIEAGLDIAERQRLSDYIDAVDSGFLPLFHAHSSTGATLGDLAVNLQAILAINEAPAEAMAAA